MSFKTDRKIELAELHKECVRQPDLVGKYAKKAAKARGEYEALKLKLEIREGELSIQIREAPSDFGLTKSTENTITAAINSHKDIIKLKAELIEARENWNTFEAAVKALDSKDRQLTNLVKLHGQEWYAGPTVPINLAEEIAEARKEAAKGIDKKVRKNSRRKKNA